MSRPIFTAETNGAFAEYLLAAAESVARVLRSGEVPEAVMVSIAERISVTPWLPGAPLSGLLAWAAHLTDPSWTAQVHPPFTSTGLPTVSLSVVGELDGRPCELHGSSWRGLPSVDLSVTGTRQPVDVAKVRELAAVEVPIPEAFR